MPTKTMKTWYNKQSIRVGGEILIKASLQKMERKPGLQEKTEHVKECYKASNFHRPVCCLELFKTILDKDSVRKIVHFKRARTFGVFPLFSDTCI